MADKNALEISQLLPRIEAGPGFTQAIGAVNVQAGTPLIKAVVLSAASQNLKNLINTILNDRMKTPKAEPTPAPTPSPTPAGKGKRRSKRCSRKITTQIQKKLNELGYKLKPTRRAPDGVDGIFGRDTYNNLVKALGKKVVGRNRFVARDSRNCRKLLGLLQKAKSAPAPTPIPGPSPSGPTPDRGLGRQPGMPIGGIVDKAIAPIVDGYNEKIMNKILELKKEKKLTPENEKNIRTLNITLRGLRTQLRSLIMKTMKLERSNLLTDDGKEYSQNKVTARAKELANKYFSPLMDAPNKLGDANYVAQLDQRLRNIEKTTLRESVKFDLKSFTEELNDYKSEKQDQSFKKLVKTFKK